MILDTIKKRRSVFPPQFNEEEISALEITTLLEAANWAPSHYKTEPWRFKVIHSQESKAKFSSFIAETYKEKITKFSEIKYKKLKGMPFKSGAVIAICMQRDENERAPEWEEISAVAMAVQNLWLQATQMEIGGFWSSPRLIINKMHHFFKLNEGEKCLGFFYIGKYDHTLQDGERGNIQEKTVWL